MPAHRPKTEKQLDAELTKLERDLQHAWEQSVMASTLGDARHWKRRYAELLGRRERMVKLRRQQ